MDREGRDVMSVGCMKNDVRNVVSDADGMKNIWRKYMEKLLHVENDWDGEDDCPVSHVERTIDNCTGCTQDTNIQHLHEETLILPIHEHLQLHASQYKQKTQHPSHLLHKHNILQHSKAKKNNFSQR